MLVFFASLQFLPDGPRRLRYHVGLPLLGLDTCLIFWVLGVVGWSRPGQQLFVYRQGGDEVSRIINYQHN
jgi:hypothetical protein